MYKEITKCRISESPNLISVLNLGKQALTGVFPKGKDTPITSGPLELVWCPKSELLQLKHSYYPEEMYGDNYGYRSGLNRSMVNHLKAKVEQLQRLYPLQSGDIVLDIGSNDATLLKHYSNEGLRRIGIDPTGVKFKEYYTGGIELIPDFFSATAFKKMVSDKKAKIITSIAMFYDIQNPNKFVSDFKSILHEKGIWVMEMYYLPILLKYNAYDSICHEHITYLSFNHINYLCKKNNLKIFKTSLNSMNCGSIRYFICHKDAKFKLNFSSIQKCKKLEKVLSNEKCLYNFKKRIQFLSNKLRSTIKRLKENKKTIHIYGASTKGNILIQYTKLTTKEIDFAADRNPLKWNRKMPGSNIPIISENKSRLKNPDAYLVLPWHFKKEFIKREKRFLSKGGQLIFPLPIIHTLSKKNYTRDT